MTTDISCYACTEQATSQCPRCGRLYCDDHGEALCASCLDPASAVPSATLYRGSLLALLVAAALAVWLLVLTPRGGATEAPAEVLRASSTAIAGDVQAQPTTASSTTDASPQPTTSGGSATPGASPTPTSGSATPTGTAATRTPTPTPTSTPGAGGAQQYTVQSGDTLSTIATRFKPASENPVDYVTRLARFNGIDVTSTLNIGQVIQIPPN